MGRLMLILLVAGIMLVSGCRTAEKPSAAEGYKPDQKKYMYGFTDKKIRKAYKKEQKAKRKVFEDPNNYAYSRKLKRRA